MGSSNLLYVGIIGLFTATVSGLARKEGTFQSPAPVTKPRFRYWLPDASVDPDTVVSDIHSLGSVGGGGVEFLPYYGYGGQLGGPPAGVSWSESAFGSRAYINIFEKVLAATQEANLVIDLSLYPGSGGAVPAQYQDEGLQWDLVPYTTSLSASGSYEGLVPGFNETRDLVAVVASAVVMKTTQNVTNTAVIGVPGSSRMMTTLTVVEDSLVDVEANVSNGSLILELPALPGNQTYQLTAFYQNQTLGRGCIAGDNPQNYIQNGSFFVDHFSVRGAETTIHFWENVLLSNSSKALLAKIGNYIWEDSEEFHSTINWTPDLPKVFEEMHGYSLKPYLPLIAFGNNNINLQSGDPGDIRFVTTSSDQGESFVNDYRATLLVCYERYLTALRTWAHELGMQSSMQPAYNLPIDALGSVSYVDAPEGETLQFDSGAVDSFRQFAGPAAISARNILSCELGSTVFAAYRQPMTDLAQLFNRAFAGGVNQAVIHGQAFSGYYPNTTWPGFNTFGYLVANSWSPRLPLWDNGLKELLDYASRVQFILQSGVPKVDVAFYLKDSATDPNFPTQYNGTDLLGAGYTYNYLSPLNFDLPQAFVHNGSLAPRGPSYKALIIESSQNLTSKAMKKINQYAEAGLPILLVNGLPGVYPEGRDQDEQDLLRQIQALRCMPNVYNSTHGSIATTLAKAGITPRISIIGNSTNVYSVWRQDDAAGTDYAFIYSDNTPFSGQLKVVSTGIPFLLDPWTGTRKPLLTYKEVVDGVQIPVRLAANQTIIFEFVRHGGTGGHALPIYHLDQSPTNIVGPEYDCGSKTLSVQIYNVPAAGNWSITTSTGRSYKSLPAGNLSAPFPLVNWTLTVERWDPPSDLHDLSVYANKSNITQQLSAPLSSWPNIPGLNETAGLGFYTANFTWSDNDSADGAYLRIDKVINPPRIYINGIHTPSVDISRPQVDISPYLRVGENEVLIKMASTYWNRLRPVITEIESEGINLWDLFPASLLPPAQDEGIIGDVTILPYHWRCYDLTLSEKGD